LNFIYKGRIQALPLLRVLPNRCETEYKNVALHFLLSY